MARSDPTSTKLLASSGTIALILFFVLGFAFGAWAWAWVVFLIPGLVAIWFGDGGRRGGSKSAQGLPPGHEGDEAPPSPQRYQG